MSKRVFALTVIAFLLVTAQAAATNSASAEHNGILHYIETDKYTYELPETVVVLYVATNIGTEPLTIMQSQCTCPIVARCRDPFDTVIWQDPVCGDVLCPDVLDPLESYELLTAWDMYNGATGELVQEPGIYVIEGKLQTPDPDLWFVIPLPIEITERPTTAPELPKTWGIIKGLYR